MIAIRNIGGEIAVTATGGPFVLLDELKGALRVRHYSRRTEEAYVAWVKRFICFSGKRHPREMGEAEVQTFLAHLATQRRVTASTQNQALSALLFLYREVLKLNFNVDVLVRARRPERLPVVLTRQEVKAILNTMAGTAWLVASLLYGAGLRLMECLTLRVKDLDFSRNEIVVRDGKGQKDRVTMFPEALKGPLASHLERVQRLHEQDLKRGTGRVSLPGALAAAAGVRGAVGTPGAPLRETSPPYGGLKPALPTGDTLSHRARGPIVRSPTYSWGPCSIPRA